MTTPNWREEFISFGYVQYLRGPWRIKRPMGCTIWNVWREEQHVAYMPSLIAAQQYCERQE